MQKWFLSIAILALMLPAVGQAQFGGPPPRTAAGHGIDVPGWWARLDDPAANRANLMLAPMESGYHVMTGPSAIFWDPDQTASGEYTVSATFTLTKLPATQEAYGLFIGGADLDSDNQHYTYFLIREDGRYLIKQRHGAKTMNVAGDWAEHAAVMKPDTSGRLENTLSIHVAGDTVTFMANGKEVASHPASGLDTDGVAGLRVNHNLDVQVTGFDVEQPDAEQG